ncbi:hypothetical protein RR46_05775 [Papilio xuthus]|uniref:Uncharacterized protein n=1 Tax=Papilio xuthus TaxID=66420 RepID=A0A194PNG0_PAPXU|nr:hypothetical protein RR46_05775 [Papilio xuthus]
MVDTTKAKEYMKSKEVFHSLGYSDTVEYAVDSCGNKVMYSDYKRNIDFVASSVWEDQDGVTTLSSNLKELADLIEENKLLFAQIDYMERKKPIKESLNIDMKLIVQNIMYVNRVMTQKRYTSNVLAMQGRSPLCALGFVAQLVCGAGHVVVEAVPHTAVLCHLFVTLCRKAGLSVSLAFVKEPSLADIDCDLIIREVQRGCIFVVTEQSDIDSAIDNFIVSASQDPWRIRRVLVQESIVEPLKQILEWRSNRFPNSLLPTPNVECNSAYNIHDRLFLFEYTGLEHSDHHVVIEAYRTDEELLSLLNTYKPFTVSLWCADISQANQIAYGIDSTVIWINDFGSIDGPIKSSQAFYSIIDISYAKDRIELSIDVEKQTARALNWSKQDPSKRYTLLNMAIEKTESIGVKEKKADVLKSLEPIDFDGEDGNFVKVTNVGICVGIEKRAMPFVLFSEFEIKNVLKCLLKGFGVVISSLSEKDKVFVDDLGKCAPILYKGVSDSEECLVTSRFSQYKVKVVRS